MNRLAILRLTQTCTTILESICNEIDIAGPQVVQELSGPILVLEKFALSILPSCQFYLLKDGLDLSNLFYPSYNPNPKLRRLSWRVT